MRARCEGTHGLGDLVPWRFVEGLEHVDGLCGHEVWDELCSLRFVDAGHNVMIMGPVGVGKTFMASALGHAAVRRRFSVVFCRSDVLLKRLRASRLDNSHDAEMRKLMRVDLLILDDGSTGTSGSALVPPERREGVTLSHG